MQYLQWEDLTKWDAEIRGESKKDPFFKISKSNQVELEEAPAPIYADTGTALKLANAFKRRGVAMELAGSLSFKSHELIVDWF